MIVYRIAKSEFAQDLSGRGSFLYGGRWNSEGKYALYTSTHRSLAFLELLVHVPLAIISKAEYKIITLEIPTLSDYPTFDSLVNSKASGDEILLAKKHLYFDVPSVIFPEEKNIIINPLHHLAAEIKIISTKELKIDSRIL